MPESSSHWDSEPWKTKSAFLEPTNQQADDLIDDFMYHRGLFLPVANTQGKKVMVLSSGGTLLKSWYNKNTNPTPYSLAVLEIRRARNHPLRPAI
jgi:thiamine biosynthesis protein ThiC